MPVQRSLASDETCIHQEFRYIRQYGKIAAAAADAVRGRLCGKHDCEHLDPGTRSMADQGISGRDHAGACWNGDQLDQRICAGAFWLDPQAEEMTKTAIAQLELMRRSPGCNGVFYKEQRLACPIAGQNCPPSQIYICRLIPRCGTRTRARPAFGKADEYTDHRPSGPNPHNSALEEDLSFTVELDGERLARWAGGGERCWMELKDRSRRVEGRWRDATRPVLRSCVAWGSRGRSCARVRYGLR
jgi:hypothetical protein